MKSWTDTAINLLKDSLYPVAQELNEIDWKSGLSNKTDRLAQHICAFANQENGGYLAYGINDDGSTTELSKQEIDDIIRKLGNVALNNLSEPVTIDHDITEFNGGTVLLIKIPESVNKPIHLRGKTIYEGYKRSAGHTVKLSQTDVKNLIARSFNFEFEQASCLRNLSTDEVINLLDFSSYFTLQEKRLPDTKQAILNMLADDDLITKNAMSWDITNLGAILFAKDLHQVKSLRRKAARIVVYKDTSRINALKEYEYPKGYASGFEDLINYIMHQVSENEIIEKALRTSTKMYPEVAIREFVANALIHQDFSISGTGVMIEIFTDRIEITNPGVPLVDINRFIDVAPKSRNEQLASLMRRLHICEERGSGIDRAIEKIENYQLPAPKFIRGDDYTRVTLYAPTKLTTMQKDDRIRACYQHTCLYYVNNKKVNNRSIRERFGINKNNVSSASKIIGETVEAGLIKNEDPGNTSKKFITYIPFWA